MQVARHIQTMGWTAALVFACATPPALASTPADTLRIDSQRSHAQFMLRLLWITPVRGRFDTIHGTLTWSPSGEVGIVDAWIDVTSARMSHARYTRWMLQPEFFDVQRYPRIHFVSTPVALTSLATGGPLHGHLTLRGVTRAMDFQMQPSHCPEPRTQPCTLKLHGSVQRSLFGMRAHHALLSDRVTLDLTIVLVPAH